MVAAADAVTGPPDQESTGHRKMVHALGGRCYICGTRSPTPLHDAQLGGYFFAHAVREGGGA